MAIDDVALFEAAKEALFAARDAFEEVEAERNSLRTTAAALRVEVEKLKAPLTRMVEDDCWYGDGCVSDKRCHPCDARHALGIHYDEEKFQRLQWERYERQQQAQKEES